MRRRFWAWASAVTLGVALVGGTAMVAPATVAAKSAPLHHGTGQVDPPGTGPRHHGSGNHVAGHAAPVSPREDPHRGEARGSGAGYWTARRRAAAKLIPASKLHRGHVRRPEAELAPARGRPHRVPGRRLGSDRALAGPRATEVTDPTTYPYRTNGVAFFKIGRHAYACSATVVDAPNRSVVVTAGHCVNNGGPYGRWASHWAFAPAYHDGRAPYGFFYAREIWTTGPWLHSSTQSYDVGAAVLGPNRRRHRVESVVGGQGIATGQNRDQTYDAFGYPASYPFDGQHLEECLSPYLGDDPLSFSFGGPPTISISCDMTDGSSGGGWIIDGQYVNGINDYGYDDEPGVMFSPYFGAAEWKLYREVRRR